MSPLVSWADPIDRALTHTRVARALFGVAAGPSWCVGRYEIDRLVATGGYGLVFAARDPALGRQVAIKFLRASSSAHARERIRREARAAAEVNHPNVATVLDVGEYELAAPVPGLDPRGMFLAMEYVEGCSFDEWLLRDRGLGTRLDLLKQAADGLAAVHRAGLVHGDFKPRNALVTPGGTLKIVDFGLARSSLTDTTASHGSQRVTKGNDSTTLWGGTPRYMAPEQFRGVCGPASDQYAWCLVAWEALVGSPPFPVDHRGGRYTRGVPARPSAMPRRIYAVLERGLQSNANARWPNMATAAEHLLASSGRRPSLRIGIAVAASALAILAASETISTPPPTASLPFVSGSAMRSVERDVESVVKRGERELDAGRLASASLHGRIASRLAASIPSRGPSLRTDLLRATLHDIRGQFDEARTLRRRIYAQARAADLDDVGLRAATALAVASYHHDNDRASARDWLRHAFSIAPRARDRHGAYLHVHRVAADLFGELGDPGSGSMHARVCSLLAAGTYPPDAVMLARCAIAEAQTSMQLGRYDDALSAAERARTLLAGAVDDEHAVLGRTYSQIAHAHFRAQNFDLARNAVERAHRITVAAFGPLAPASLTVRLQRCTVLTLMNDLETAAAEADALLVDTERVYGSDAIELAAIANLRGRIARAMEQLDSAETHVQRAVVLFEQHHGPHDPATITAKLGLLRIYEAQARWEPMLALAEEIIAARIERGAPPVDVAIGRSARGRALYGLGERAEGRALVLAALEVLRTHDPGNPSLPRDQAWLGVHP